MSDEDVWRRDELDAVREDTADDEAVVEGIEEITQSNEPIEDSPS